MIDRRQLKLLENQTQTFILRQNTNKNASLRIVMNTSIHKLFTIIVLHVASQENTIIVDKFDDATSH